MDSRVHVRFESDHIVVEIAGRVASGSEGNATTAAWRERIKAKLSREGSSELRGIIFDLRELEYEFGDSTAGLWIDAMRRQVPFVILARGRTYAALKSLIDSSNVPAPLVKTMEEAIQLIQQAPPAA